MGILWLGRGAVGAAGVAPLALAALVLAGAREPWVQVARSLAQLVCLAQIGSALLDRLASPPRGAFRAVGAIVLAALSGWMVAILLGLFGGLRAPVFAMVVALLAWVSGVAAARGPAAHDPRSVEPAPGRERVAVALAFAICAATIGHDLHAARYQAPGAALYDDLSYHLPAALLWDRTGDLRMLRFEFGDPSTCFYPIGGELSSWIVLAGAPGSDFLVRWSQLPAAMGILFAVWALARRAGATAWGALLALLLTLTVPRLYPELALSAGNDVWAAFFALAALLAASPVPDSGPRVGRWILFAASLGALVGTKYLTLAWVPWLAGAAAASGTLASLLRGARSDRIRVAASGLALLLGGGGFTYARNLATTGNPLFPQPVAVAGLELLPGWRATGMAERIAREAHGTWDLGAFVDAPWLLGGVWGSALLPVAALLPLLAGWRLWRRRGDAEARWLLALAAGPAWILTVYARFLHDHRDIRYALAAIPLAAVAVAGVSKDWSPSSSRSLGAVLGAVSLWALFEARDGPGQVALICALGAGLLAAFGLVRRPFGFPLAAAACLLVALGSERTLERYAERRSRHEAAARELERLTGGRPATVAYVGGNRPYFFHGERLQNRIEIVPHRQALPARHFRWGQPIEPGPFAAGGPRVWSENLRELGVEFVVVEGPGGGARPANWLGRRRSGLLPVAEGEGWRIYTWRTAHPRASAPSQARD